VKKIEKGGVLSKASWHRCPKGQENRHWKKKKRNKAKNPGRTKSKKKIPGREKSPQKKKKGPEPWVGWAAAFLFGGGRIVRKISLGGGTFIQIVCNHWGIKQKGFLGGGINLGGKKKKSAPGKRKRRGLCSKGKQLVWDWGEVGRGSLKREGFPSKGGLRTFMGFRKASKKTPPNFEGFKGSESARRKGTYPSEGDPSMEPFLLTRKEIRKKGVHDAKTSSG